MRYDWNRPLSGLPAEREWYEEMDRRLFHATVLPHGPRPFASLLSDAALAGKTVLELGVGMGSHAQMIARAAKRFIGVDLCWSAVSSTARRLELFDTPGRVLQMDGERLAFRDESFDLVWSWGVIHHSANTRGALEEIRRVLKPDGRALVMVYHRALMPWFLYAGLIRGVLLGGFRRHRNIHEIVQSFSDGAIARYYSPREWRAEVRGLFAVEALATYGNRDEIFPLPAGAMKERLVRMTPEAAMRFWLTRCRQGSLLFSRLRPL
ncbi:MAG TPA: class I SAM-dependent methyltransferase [Candidatus Acidoferrales bacterium]|nr:class I SAM-dependent methyltransferase [Candidatus Acidoferrales bacterium]